ncbi:SMI1/KNR4 family protein [Endozoicomonas sp. Mp262]|uniref:SMI1/KNR4 family protein n=1 Tax=Endozoicomonas sp. Mp262 TaxID=2919499 RepID=UPI0021DB6B9F
MEDIIEILREKAVDIPAPLTLPDEDDLVSIEEELLIPLPQDLREFLLQLSDVVYGSLEPVTVTDPHSHTYLPEVAAIAWDTCVPRHLIPVCEDNGSYYCINEEGSISHWSSGEESDESWGSIWQWVREVWLES